MEAILQVGANLLVAHRRLFATDTPRFFVGRCLAYEAGIVKIVGRTFVRDMGTGGVHAKQDERTKLISLSSGTVLTDELPESVDLADLDFQAYEGSVIATDNKGFEMNLDEHPHH